MTSEGLVKKALKKHLKEIGAYYFMPVQMGYGVRTLDVLLCYKGKFYGIECKREGVGKPSSHQACVMREIAEAGGGVWLENSVGLEETRKRLT